MKKKIFRSTIMLAVAGMAFSLSGCASFMHHSVTYTDSSAQPLSDLTQMANSAVSATQQLASARNEVANASMTHNQRVQEYYQKTYSSKALNQPMTFYHPTFMKASKILKQLFVAAGWKFSVTGQKPSVPIMIQVQGKNKPIINYIRDIESQMGVQGKVLMFPSSKVAILQYANNAFANDSSGTH
jgi:hypothetical protein